MPTLDWIGKDAVIRHHKDVPFRLLEADAALSYGQETGNLIVQGDNLHALKALLPKFAGKVKCIYIDPPYNTGNEGWIYNDKVNAPEMKKWLGEVVGKEAEDLSRHDKWLCMMYPRLMLLKQFLTEDGAIFVSIDDNEVASLRLLMDEIFRRGNFVANVIWQKKYTVSNDSKWLAETHDHIVIFAKDKELWRPNRMERTAEMDSRYSNPDGHKKGPWKSTPLYAKRSGSEEEQNFSFTFKNGFVWKAPKGTSPRFPEAKLRIMDNNDEIWFGFNGMANPSRKTFLDELKIAKPPATTIWLHTEAGNNHQATEEVKEHSFSESFATPKPTRLIQRILQIATDKDSIILDSFAGSGTTGHAVLKQNAEDGGTRRFILVELEKKISEGITAERVRRVAGGYTNAKGEAVEGLGGGFQFCRLSEEPLFNEFGDIREDVSFAQLADFVWFAETGEGYMEKGIASPFFEDEERKTRCFAKGMQSPSPYWPSPLLGVKDGTAVYLLFNGILGDRRPAGGNILTKAVYDELPKHDGPQVIYAAATKIGEAERTRRNIIFKQTPYAIEV